MLKAGADVDAQDFNGSTPLMEATKTSNMSKIKLLVRYGADLDLLDKSGRSALDYAASNRSSVFLRSIGKAQRKQSVIAPTIAWKDEQWKKQAIEQHNAALFTETSKSLSSMETIYESDHESLPREVEVKARSPYTTRAVAMIHDDEQPSTSNGRNKLIVQKTYITEEDAAEYTSSNESDDNDYQSLVNFNRSIDDSSSVYNSLVRFHRHKSYGIEHDDGNSSDGTYYDALSHFGSKRSAAAISLLSNKQLIAHKTHDQTVDSLTPSTNLLRRSHRRSDKDSSIHEDSDTESALDSRRQLDRSPTFPPSALCSQPANHRQVSWEDDDDEKLDGLPKSIHSDNLEMDHVFSNELDDIQLERESKYLSEEDISIHSVPQESNSTNKTFKERELKREFLSVPDLQDNHFFPSSYVIKHRSEPVGEVCIPSLQRHLSAGHVSCKTNFRRNERKSRRSSSDDAHSSSMSDDLNKIKSFFEDDITRQTSFCSDTDVCGLHDAIRYGQSNSIRHFITAGADVNGIDESGYTALMVAAQVVVDNVVLDDLNLLLSADVDIHQWDWKGYTALHHAVMYNNIPLVVFLISNGANLNIQGYNGYTPLMEATTRLNSMAPGERWTIEANVTREIVRLLLQANANVNVKSKDKQTALTLSLPEPPQKVPLPFIAMLIAGIEIIESVVYMLVVSGAHIPSREWINKWTTYGQNRELSDREEQLVGRILGLETWFDSMRSTVRSLMDLSRLTLRKQIGMNIDDKVEALAITPELCGYLLLEDINAIDDDRHSNRL